MKSVGEMHLLSGCTLIDQIELRVSTESCLLRVICRRHKPSRRQQNNMLNSSPNQSLQRRLHVTGCTESNVHQSRSGPGLPCRGLERLRVRKVCVKTRKHILRKPWSGFLDVSESEGDSGRVGNGGSKSGRRAPDISSCAEDKEGSMLRGHCVGAVVSWCWTLSERIFGWRHFVYIRQLLFPSFRICNETHHPFRPSTFSI